MDKFTEYEEGLWYPWDGSRECPFDLKNDDIRVAILDTSPDRWGEKAGAIRGGITVEIGDRGIWQYDPKTSRGVLVIGFYIVSYAKPKEMTVAEIEEALGHRVKVVK